MTETSLLDAGPPPVVNLGDIVRAVNKGTKTFVATYDSKKYVLEPGKDSFIPFDAAILYFGDPRSGEAMASLRSENGLVAFVADRATEVRRLRTKYGEGMGDETTVTAGPNVELYTLDGTRIVTVLDDPSGDRVRASSPTVFDQNQLLATVQRQQQTINLLMERMGLTGTGGTAPAADVSTSASSTSSSSNASADEAGVQHEDPNDPPTLDGLPPEDKPAA